MIRLIGLFLLTLAAWAQNNGWTDITPDATFSHWTRISIPPGTPVSQPSQWKIDKTAGTVLCEGNGGHEMLRYDTDYKDFVLHAEWKYTKVADENAKYNSGVFVRNDADGTIWHQAQPAQTGAYLFGNTLVNGQQKRVTLKDKVKENTIKPVGEWNTFEITAKGSTLSLVANGKLVSEWTDCEVLHGYVGLEAEGFRVEFRNIRIKPL